MTEIEIIAQIVSIAGMVANLLSYQQKAQKRIILFQFFASLLFSASFFMLGEYVGAILNLIGIARAIVFMYKEKTRATHIAWLIGFSLAFASTYVLIFTVFGKEVNATNLIIQLLPVVAMIIATVSFRLSARDVRRLGLISSPLWLIYNIFCFSIGGICTEILNIISMIVGIVRLDVKRKKEPKSDENTKS